MENPKKHDTPAGKLAGLQNYRAAPSARSVRAKRNKASGGARWQKIRALMRHRWLQWGIAVAVMIGVQFLPMTLGARAVDGLIGAACGANSYDSGCGALVSAIVLVVLLLLTIFVSAMTLRALWRQRRARLIRRADGARDAP
jgi:hypothetical protein